MEEIASHGWTRNLRLANETAEIIITTEVGPRIIDYRLHDGGNVFKLYDDELGSTSESSWVMRGGHRLWIAPESNRTYCPDNDAIDYKALGENHVVLHPKVESANGIVKSTEVSLHKTSSEVTLVHRIKAIRDLEGPVAAWALSVMSPGGIAIVPQPEFIPHPSDTVDNALTPEALLPNNRIVLWPYTSLADSRFGFTGTNFTVTQRDNTTSAKVGFLHQLGKVAYWVDGCLFTKTIDYQQAAEYPDQGCNFELYTNAEMLELESLSPLKLLKENDTIEHTEHWSLKNVTQIDPATLPFTS